MASSNNLVPIIVVVGIASVIAITYLSGDDKKMVTAKDTTMETQKGELSSEELALLGATGDTPEDTIRALLSRTESAESKARDAVAQVNKLARENQDLKQLEARMAELIESKLAEQEKKTEEIVINTVKSDEVKVGNVESVPENLTEQDMLDELGLTAALDMPLNLKLPENLKVANRKNTTAGGNSANPLIATLDSNELMWIEPIDRKVTTNREGVETVSFPDVSIEDIGVLKDIDQGRENLTGIKTKKNGEPVLKPFYTIPENATLMSSVNMTAIIGRIPMDGTVQDPFPFKILIGKENLATNGIKIPNIDRIVVSGTATGDYTLKCAYGRINSLTYTFNDGTIQTVSNRESKGESLGFISDEQGVPCISGDYITNAPEYLAQKVGVSAFAAAAQAYAASQTTTVTSAEGNTTSSVNGDSGKYAAGQALAAGTDATTQWLDKRQQNAFDAIFVQLGQRVAVHIQKEIPIDYNPNGRKVSHYANSKNRTRTLD
ncbi:TIGR03752 family integrating conjugative element protein [Motilimonas cestriensis]|uniref:TIGR03752 family integrating conjugative element protein n=1 Tax=Motilimonas cestriensis TaxID=2742685 RepID=UPI003DA4243B